MTKLPRILVSLIFCVAIFLAHRAHAEKLEDGVWVQNDSTSINFTTGSTTLLPGYKITLAFPSSAVVNNSGTNKSVTGQTNPSRTNNGSARQITLTLDTTILPSTNLTITFTDGLSSYNGDTSAKDSVAITVSTGGLEPIDYGTAVISNTNTLVQANVPGDLDDDGMPSWWELQYGLDPNDPTDAALDYDNDGLTNLQEYIHSTNPLDWDTDDGGVSDGMEVKLNKDPLDPDDDFTPITFAESPPQEPDQRADSDGDGVGNNIEKKYGTNPNDTDTDDDGVNDYDEIFKYGTNPNSKDSDGDGLTDFDELFTYLTNPLNRDTDFDGLTDFEEVKVYNTNPSFWDTDKGGMSDRDEVVNGSNPLLESDDFAFTWIVYFGDSPSELFSSLEGNKITLYEGLDLTFEAIKPPQATHMTLTFNDKSITTQKDYVKLKLISPTKPGIYPIGLTLHLANGQDILISRYVELKTRGSITAKVNSVFKKLYDRFPYFKDSALANAKIEVLTFNQLTNSLELYSNLFPDISNPAYTSAEGKYLTILQPGSYLIRITKYGMGKKEILYTTDKYTFYSPDLTYNYNYDLVIWSLLFVGIFIITWYIQILLQKIAYIIQNIGYSKKAHQ